MSNNLIVQLSLIDKMTAGLAAAEGKIRNFASKAKQALGQLMSIPNLVIGSAIFGLGKQFSDAAIQMEALDNRMRAAIGGFGSAEKEMGFVKKMAMDMGVSFKDLGQAYSGFAASALRSNMSLAEVRQVFTDIGTAAVSMQLTKEKTGLVFLALEQMASKGVVSMEELRRQLGESLPGAVTIGARAMGKTSAEFIKMVSEGKVLASDFLPKFAKAVREELGGSFDDARKSMQANYNRIGNVFFKFKAMVGSVFAPAINELGEGFTVLDTKLESINKNIEKFKAVIMTIVFVIRTVWNGLQMAGDLVANTIMWVINVLRLAWAQFDGWVENIIQSIQSLGPIIIKILKGDWKGALDSAKDAMSDFKSRVAEIGAETSNYINNIKINANVLEASWSHDLDNIADAMAKMMLQWEKVDSVTGKPKKKPAPLLQPPTDPNSEAKKTKGEINPYWNMGPLREISTDIRFRVDMENLENASSKIHESLVKSLSDKLTGSGRGLLDVLYSGNELIREIKFDEYMNALEKFKISTMKTAKTAKEIWHDFTESLDNNFKSMWDNITDLNTSFSEKMANVAQGIYRMMTDLLYEYLRNFILAKTTQAAMATTTGKIEQSENIQNAATEGVSTAMSAGKSVAKIPYVGAILAIAAIGTVMALMASSIAKAKSYDIGTTDHPGGWSQVHKNELMYLPRHTQVIQPGDSATMLQESKEKTIVNNFTINNPGENFISQLTTMMKHGKADGLINQIKLQMGRI